MYKGKILIADDEDILTTTLQKILNSANYSTSICNYGSKFFSMLAEINPDVVMLDIYFGDVNGITLLKQLKDEGWDKPVIMMTAHAEVNLAVEAMKEGAIDFITKPFDLNHLNVVIEKSIAHANLQSKVKILEEQIEEQRSRSGILGSSVEIRRVIETARRLSFGNSTTVLLEGESGTGKELFARFVHQESSRSAQAFITVNCGAIPKDLAESEFFGYEKGAFTGATERMKQGKFELANGGSILLDEVGELSLDMQVKLLRVLEDKRFYRLGGSKEIEVDVRVIAATNRDLAKEVEAGRFREDLFYRLNVAVIKIPPLRDRKEDIIQMTHAFVQEFCKKFVKPVPIISPEAQHVLQQLQWKGNVRELRNAVERVVLLYDVPILRPEHFGFLKSLPSPTNGQRKNGTNGQNFTLEIPESGIAMREVLRDLILKTLTITNGNQVQAAKVLGITRSKLRYRMDQLGIEPEERSYKISA
ncbi:MAG: sigma-54-dependent Fis family transcriptional regulator [Ignavibacteriales bacterium]|nr:sigma-54-dependent Fis family transcriptional regulator [Ignavibacteriales bacterium]